MKLHPYYIVAGASFLPYAVAALLLTKNGLMQGILCLVFTLLLAVCTVYLQSRFLPGNVKKCFVYPLSVGVLFCFCALVLRWSLLIPFFTAAQFSLAMPGALVAVKRTNDPKTALPVLLVAAVASLLFALVGSILGLKG